MYTQKNVKSLHVFLTIRSEREKSPLLIQGTHNTKETSLRENSSLYFCFLHPETFLVAQDRYNQERTTQHHFPEGILSLGCNYIYTNKNQAQNQRRKQALKKVRCSDGKQLEMYPSQLHHHFIHRYAHIFQTVKLEFDYFDQSKKS